MDKQRVYELLNGAYFSDNCHEKEVVENLGELLNDGDTFADVGASLGQFTFFANRQMRGGRIVAFEPDPIRYEELSRNCALWAGDSRNMIIAHPFAVCDHDGPESFFTTHACLSGGLFARETDDGTEFHKIDAEGATLDRLFPDDHPALIKVDVEGAELRVLRGAEKILERGESQLLLELHPFADPKGQQTAAEVIAYLDARGYVMERFHGRHIFRKR